MNIKLSKIKIFCLTCEEDDKGSKRNHIKSIIDAEFVQPIIGIAKNKSGASGFMRMVERGLRAQIPGQPFSPFLMIEDDISLERSHNDEISIPDDTDILYVGLSKCSMNDHCFHYANYYQSVENYPGIIKINHMLATHGIMICSPIGAAVFQRTMLEVFLSDQSWDIPLAFIQPYYNVYALREPLVYQDSKYGGDEACTRFSIMGYGNPLPNEWKKKDLATLRML